MLDGGSKHTLVSFPPQQRLYPGLMCRFLNTRKTTVIHDGKAWRAALRIWKYFTRKLLQTPENISQPRSLYLGLEGLARRRVGGRCWRRLYPAGPHVGQELLRDLGQDVFGETGHAQDVVPGSVDVVPKRNKLEEKRDELNRIL